MSGSHAGRGGPLERLPRAGPGLALLLAAVATVLIATWPQRPDLPNASWYPVAVVRAGGLALWGWLAGSAAPTLPPALRRAELVRIVVAAVATAPLETLAHVASVPDASLVWSLAAAAWLGVAAYGLAWLPSALLHRVRAAWLLPLASPLAATGLLLADLQVGPPLLMPWLVPSAPSWAAAALGLAVAAATAWTAVSAGRPAEAAR